MALGQENQLKGKTEGVESNVLVIRKADKESWCQPSSQGAGSWLMLAMLSSTCGSLLALSRTWRALCDGQSDEAMSYLS